MDLFKGLFCKRRRPIDSPSPKKRSPGHLCKICSESIISSRTLSCGDSFCETCLTEYLLQKTKCPVCEAEIQKSPAYPCFLLDDSSATKEKSSENYFDRVRKFKEFKEMVKLQQVTEGMKVDVKDTEGIWCSGTVKSIINVENSTLLLIHYDKWDSIFDEIFQIDSPRLAPQGFYINRNILRYRLVKNDGNRQAEVIN